MNLCVLSLLSFLFHIYLYTSYKSSLPLTYNTNPRLFSLSLPLTVACSTVTVDKCLAALRTILGFPYFQPTCLCREPHLDRECNVFREFIFDHPCNFVENRSGSSVLLPVLFVLVLVIRSFLFFLSLSLFLSFCI